MADSDKNIRITTSKNKTTFPNIVFTGSSAGTSVLTLEVRDDNSVAFTGTDGDVFSLDYNLSTGTIWSVNDKSGTPLLRSSAGGTIGIAEYGTGVIVGIGQTNPKYKLDVQGWAGFASTGDGTYTILIENGLTTGNNALSIRAANSLRFYNSGNTLYTGFVGAQSGINTTYILPPRTPTGTATSYLSASIDGVMAWVAAPTSGGSGSVNSGTANYAAYYATTTNAVSENANLQFTGSGVSVGGNVQSTSTTTGSLQVRGGFGITGNAFIGGTTAITNSTASIGTNSGALVVTGGVGIGGSLYTSAGSTSSVSGVLLQNNNVSASTYNKVAVTAPASSATLTLANGSTLATSGGNSLTLTTTANSNVTFPVAGILTTQGNDLSVFALTTSLQLKNLISDEVGSGALVFATSPEFTTSVTTGSGSFDVFNTNATTVNAFGAATTLNLGQTSGKTTIRSTDVSTSTSTGALVVSGGVGIGGSLYTPLTSPSSISGVILSNTYLSAVGGTFTSAMYAANIRPLSGNTVTIQQTDSTNSAQFNNTRLAVLYSTNSTSEANGAIVVTGGVGVGLSVSIAGRLQMFNGANYTSFVSSATSNVTYTLPPTAPSGTGTSYLSASTTGVMAWVAAPTSGGSGSPGGSNGEIQFNNAGSFGGISGLTYLDPNNGVHLVVNTPPDTVTATYGTLNIGSAPFDGLSLGQWGGSIKGTIVAINAGSGFTGNFLDFKTYGVAGFAVSSDGKITVGNNVWSLPITSGTSGQVLTSNGNGTQASWTTVTGGSSSGGTVYSGTANQIAFYGATGTTVGGSSTFTNNVTTGVVNITHTTESTSLTTGALVVSGGAGFAKTVEAGAFKVGSLGYPAPNVLSSFQNSVNSYAQLVIQNTNAGSSASADFVLNNNISTDTTYYANFGINSSTFSGSSSFGLPNAVYLSATTGDLVIGTTASSALRFVINSSSSDIVSMPASGTAVSFYQPIDMKTGTDIRLWNSGNTFYTNFGAGNNTVNYDLFTPTAPVGAGLSVILVNSSGQMFFAPVVGIGVSPVGSNTAQLRRRRTLTYQFCAGYTPAASGVDAVVLKIPDSAVDGTTDVTYELKEFDISVETPSAGSSRVMLEKYTGTGAFAYAATGTSLIGGLGLTLSGAGIYVTHTNTFAGAFVTSNDKLRLNFTLLNATHSNFSIQLTMEQV
jgi:hypothetical protein